MSQVNIITLSRLMGDLISGSSGAAEFAVMYPDDEVLMKKSLVASQAISGLLVTIREKMIEEGWHEDEESKTS